MSNLHRTVEQYKCDPADPWSWDDEIILGPAALPPLDGSGDDELIDLDSPPPLPVDYGPEDDVMIDLDPLD